MSPTFHRLLKALLWIFNILYGLFGFISLVCGGVAVTLMHTEAMGIIHKWVGTYGVFGNKSLVASAGLLTSVGVFIFFTAILGFVILLRYNRCAMITYIVLVSFIMVLQFAAAISSLSISRQMPDNISAKLSALQSVTKGDSVTDPIKDPAEVMFVNIQQTWGCCGVHGHKEWMMNVTWFKVKYLKFAESDPDYALGLTGCCFAGATNCNNSSETPDCCAVKLPQYNMNPSCTRVISLHLLHSLSIVAGASLTFAFLEIFGLVVSCLFIRSMASNFDGGLERLG